MENTAVVIERAFAQHLAGDLDAAESLYRGVLRTDADHLNALQLLGALVRQRGDATQAVILLDRAAMVLEADGAATAQHAPLFCNLGDALRTVGRGIEAMTRYRQGLDLAPDMAELHAAVATEQFSQGDPAAAVASLARALSFAPLRADWWHALGEACAALGRSDDALRHYRHAVRVAPGQIRSLHAIAQLHFAKGDMPAARAAFGRIIGQRADDADSWYMLGRIDHLAGDIAAAEASYRRALDHDPELVDALFRLGLLLHDDRHLAAEAIPVYEQLIAVAPAHAEVHVALGAACRGLRRFDRALAAFREYLRRRPALPGAHFQLGRALTEAGDDVAAVFYLRQAIALGRTGVVVHLATLLLGKSLQRLGQTRQALTAFRAALAFDPVLVMAAARQPAAFSALFLMAPGRNNTPYEDLLRQAPYDANLVMLLPDFDHDPALLATRGAVVVNLVSDADRDGTTLPSAAGLIESLGKPVINHPDQVMRTSREAIPALLEGIAGCRVARMHRRAGTALRETGLAAAAKDPPFLVRRVGCHNGDDFERIETAEELCRLVGRQETADYYVIDYLDYRSPDGLFRKYRFWCVDGELLPYHLAIGAHWKLHHINTDMARHDWMKREEAAFLAAPQEVFGAAGMATLRQVCAAVGLAVFGIDCARDRDGSVVVFEANATMLIHEENPDYPYRDVHVRRIKAAFHAMLARRVAQAPHPERA